MLFLCIISDSPIWPIEIRKIPSYFYDLYHIFTGLSLE